MTQSSPPTRRSWIGRHKRLVIIASSLIFVLLALLTAGLIYVRSGRLNRFIASQIQSALADYGVRAEIGGFEVAWGIRTARIRDVKLYNQQTGQLIATLDRAEMAVEIPSPFALSLQRTIIFKRLDLTNLNVYLAIDGEGRTNWQGLHQPPPSGPSRITFDFSSLVGALNGGSIRFEDQQQQVNGQLTGLQAKARPIPGSLLDLRFTAGSGGLSYAGRSTAIEGLDVAGQLGESGASLEKLILRSRLGSANISGKVDDWTRLRYNFAAQVNVALDEVSRVFAPDFASSGAAAFDGRVEGEGSKYRIKGGFRSEELRVPGVQIREAKSVGLDDLSVESDGKVIAIAINRIRASEIELEGATLASLDGRGLTAEIVSGNMKATLSDVGVARVDASGNRIDKVKLQGLTATLENGVYRASGKLGIGGAEVGQAAIGPAEARLEATNREIGLNQFHASLFGGSASGEALIRFASSGISHLTASFSGLQTGELFKLSGSTNTPLAGEVGGQASIVWPGTDITALSGAIGANLTAQTTQTKGAIPVTGNVSVKAANGDFRVDKLALNTDNTRINASGSVSKKGDSDLSVSLESSKAEELQTIAYSIDDVEKNLSDYQPHLSGGFSFQGRLTGSLTDPSIQGDLNVGSIGMRDQTLGSLSGHLVFSPSEIAFQNGVLAAADSGSARFSYSVPRSQVSTAGRLDATVDRINLSTVLAAIGVSLEEKTAAGLITGEAHLTNLPESPTGTVVINMVNATVLGEAAQSASFKVTMDGHTARVDKAELKLAQGDLTANGSLDFKSNVFQAQGQATNINLSKLVESFGSTDVKVSGSANGNFTASGNTNHIGDLNVELTVQGQGVTVNDKDAGQLNLTARTSPGGRIDVNLVTGIVGKPQALTASIELRRPGRPIEVHSQFSSLDLGPILDAFAPNAASDIKGMVSGRLQVAGPIVNAQDEVTLDGLRGNLTLTAISTQFEDRVITIQTPLTVTLNSRELTLSQTHVSGDGIDLSLGGKLGLAEGAGMQFTLTGSASLNNLARLGPDVSLGGKITINARLEGTFSDPRLLGDMTATELEYSGLDVPVGIENGSAHIVFGGDRITIEKFTALANDGTLDVSGYLSLGKLKPKDWNLTATAKNVDIYYLGAEAVANGDVTLRGTSDDLVLAGTINVPAADYVTNFNMNNLTSGGSGSLSFGGGGASSGSSVLDAVKLNVKISAPGTLMVRNQQINTVGTAALTVEGTIGDPSITGRVALEGGTIKFQTERYDIETSTLDFPGGEETPVLNLQTEGDVAGYHLTIGLRGPVDDMQVTLRSDPDLQRSEILSLIATGKVDSNTLGSQSIVQSGLGTAGSLLSENLLSAPAQSLLGLNRFALDPVLQPNANPAARLTVGKELTKDLSFTYSSNLGSEQDQSVLVEYTVTNKFSALASYTQGGTVINGAATDTNFSIDMRLRKRFSLGYGAMVAPGTPGTGPTLSQPKLPTAEVSFENMTGIKLGRAKLRELLPVEKEGFNRALARLGERNLENYLQEQGYFRATVKERCDPEDCSGAEPHVVYDVHLGERYRLKDIRIDGTNVISYSDVSDELQSHTASFIGSVPVLNTLPLIGGLARGITSHDRVERDRDAIRSHLADMGYRSPHVESRFENGSQSGDIVLVFKVDPGEESKVSQVTFKDNRALSTAELRDKVPLKNGAVFSPTHLRDGIQAIRKSYAAIGYLEAAVHYNIADSGKNLVSVEYEVDEGVQAKVGQIEITGETKTREGAIRRYLAFKEGEVLTEGKIRQTQRDLFASGAFNEVNIHNEQVPGADASVRKVTVQVTEINPLLLVYGPGYSTDDGAEGIAQLTDANVFGRANSASLRLRISQREQLGQIQYTNLRPFGSNWALTFSTFYDRNNNLHTVVQRNLVGGGTTSVGSGPAFGIDRFASFVQTERKLTERSSIHFRYSFEIVKLINPQNIPIQEIAPNEQSIKLGEFSAGFTSDTRDSGVNPTRGQLFSVEHSFAARSLGGTVSFNKFFGTYQRYYELDPSTPLLRDSVLAFSARLGLAAPFHVVSSSANGLTGLVDRELPISERFFAGGATDLRGFGFDQAGPQAILEPLNAKQLPTLVPIGGDALMVYNFEVRYPLTKQLRLVPFYDLGNVFPLITDINWRGMTHTVGLGLRFNTPLGPVGVDYGYLLDPPSFVSAGGIVLRQPHGAFHFRFGQTF